VSEKPACVCRLAAIASQLPSIGSGMVVGVPVPPEDEASAALVQTAIDQALQEVARNGIRGAAVTPFVLERVRQATGGASLQTNVKLVLNNARVGADVAKAIRSPHVSKL
jgi:pseudouridylate synthase